MGTECKEVNKLSNIYTAVEEAALLQHFAVNKLAMIGTCQCSDITYNFKIIFLCISETKKGCSKFFVNKGAQNFSTSD